MLYIRSISTPRWVLISLPHPLTPQSRPPQSFLPRPSPLHKPHLVSIIYEFPDAPRVLGCVTRREALVRAVKEGEVLLLRHQGAYLTPLGLGRVHSRGVVGAGVEKKAAGRGRVGSWGIGGEGKGGGGLA